MSAFGPTAGPSRLRRVAIIGIVLVPLIIGGILAWALATPTAHLDRITAAIVNDDVPVTSNGQTLPLGRELAAGLMAGEEPVIPGSGSTAPATFDWVLTNGTEASEGLAGGRYAAVLTIPASFSADAVSISGPGADARQAVVAVQTTPTSAWLDPALTRAVTDAAVASLGRELTERYLAQTYDGLNTIAEQIGRISDGADDLAAGAAETASGAETLSTGAAELDAGLVSLQTGASSVAAGLAQLDTVAAPLPGQTAELARAADELARSIGEVARRSDAATAAFASVVDEVCTVPGRVCDRAREALATLVSADESLRTLAEGSRRVAVGNTALAVVAPRLAEGIDAASGGAGDVAAGAGTSQAGGAALAQGAAGVAAGTEQVATGAGQLSSGLSEASEQLPTFSDDDISTLSTVVAQPVVATVDSPETGLQSLPLFTMIALWFGALVMCLAIPVIPPRWLLTASSTFAVTGRAIAPIIAIGAAQGLVVAIAVLLTAPPPLAAMAAYIAVSVLAGVAFGLINAGLAAVLGGAGRILGAAIGVVALAAGLSSTVPPVLAAVAGALPTSAASAALGATLTGGGASLVIGVVGLAVAGLVGAALVFAGVAARRRVPSGARDAVSAQ